MKTKIPHYFTAVVIMFFLSVMSLKAQTALQIVRMKNLQHQNFSNNFSFKLYNAPSNTYGYNIFMNGQPIHHEFVLFYISPQGKRYYANKTQTEKIAALALNKLRQDKEPDITQQELKNIMKL